MSEKDKGKIRGTLRRVILEQKGGPGSGHHGHRGRRGTIGGSLPKSAGLHPGGRGVPDFRDIEKRAFVSEKTALIEGKIIYAIVSLRRMQVYKDKPYRLETSMGSRGGKFTSTAQERAARKLLEELTDEVTNRLTLEGWKKNTRGYWVAPWGPQTFKRIGLTTRQVPDRTLYELLTYLDDDGILFVPRNRAGFDYLTRQRNESHDRYWLKKIRHLRDDYYERNFEAVPEDEPYPYEGASYDEWLLEQQVDALTAPPELPLAEDLPPEDDLPPEEAETSIVEEEPPEAGGPGEAAPLPEAEPPSEMEGEPEAEWLSEEEPEEEEKQPLAERVLGALRRIITRGGPGSGHHGHRGRLGEVGGSEPGKGAPRAKAPATGVGVAQKPEAYVSQPKLAPEQIGQYVLDKMNRILNPTTQIFMGEDVAPEDWDTVIREVRNGDWAEGESFAGSVAADAMARWSEGEPVYGEEGEPVFELDERALQDHLNELNYENVQYFMSEQWDAVENDARREVDAEIRTYEDIQNLLGMTADEFLHYGEADIKNAIELEIQTRAIAELVSRGQLEIDALEAIEEVKEYLPGGRYETQITSRYGNQEVTPETMINRFGSVISNTRIDIAENAIGSITQDDINIDEFMFPIEGEREVVGYEGGEYVPSSNYIELLGFDGNEPVCAAQLRRSTINLDDISEDVLARVEAQTGLSREDFNPDFFALKLLQSKRKGEGYGTEMIMEILRIANDENRGIVGNATMSAAMFYSKLGAVGYSEVFQTEGGTAFWTAEQVSEAYYWLQSEAERISAGGEIPEQYEQEVGALSAVGVPGGGRRILLGPPMSIETPSGHRYMEFPAGRINVEFPEDMPLMYEETPGEGTVATIYARQDDEAGGVSYWIEGQGWENRRFADSTAAAQALERAGYTSLATSTPEAAEDWIANYIAEQWELRGPVTLAEIVEPSTPIRPAAEPQVGAWQTPFKPAMEAHEGEFGRGQLVGSEPGGARGGDVRIGIGEGEATMIVPDIANRWYRTITETGGGEEVQLVPLGDGQGNVRYEVIGAAPSFYEALGDERYFTSIDQAVAALEDSDYMQLNNTRPSTSGFVRDLWVGAYETIWSGPPEIFEPTVDVQGYTSAVETGEPFSGEPSVEYYGRGNIVDAYETERGDLRVIVSSGRESPIDLPDDPTGWVRHDGVQVDISPVNAQGNFMVQAKVIEGDMSASEIFGADRFYGMADMTSRLKLEGFEPIEGSQPSHDIDVRNQWIDVYDDVMGEAPTVEASIYGLMRRVKIERQGLGRMQGPSALGPGGKCYCPKCGYEQEHTTGEPCEDQKCPKCGDDLVRRGGEGSGHHGHRGRLGEVGGSEPGKGAPRVKAPSKVQVGITSAVPGKESKTVFKEMNEFKNRMSKIKGVKNLSIQPGLGGWEGQREPTWVVTYSGNGEALRLIAETAQQHKQKSVLLMRECAPPQDCSPVVDFNFDDPITPDERQEVETMLVNAGLGGWTWFRDGKGRRVLRSVAVPQWGGSRQAHLNAVRRLKKMFQAIDMPHDYSEAEVWVDVMEEEGEYAYETVLSP